MNRSNLSGLTYVVEHNPCRTEPFLIRLAGPCLAVIDHKEDPEKTQDVVVSGDILDEVAATALQMWERRCH